MQFSIGDMLFNRLAARDNFEFKKDLFYSVVGSVLGYPVFTI